MVFIATTERDPDAGSTEVKTLKVSSSGIESQVAEDYTDDLQVFTSLDQWGREQATKYTRSIPLGFNAQECSQMMRGLGNEVFFYRKYEEAGKTCFSVNIFANFDSENPDIEIFEVEESTELYAYLKTLSEIPNRYF